MTNQPMNTDPKPLYGYVCLYKGRRIEVHAPSTYAAQVQAAVAFKARKAHEVTVMLAETPDGAPVVHAPEVLP